MPLTLKEKELVYMGASVATGCKPCTNYHFKKVREADASDDEIKQAISDAMCVRDSAKAIMESHGLKLLGITGKDGNCGCAGNTTRIKELVSVGAAFAVNCTSNLEKHIATARTVGIDDDEIKSVLNAVLFIKGKAASHVDRIAERAVNAVFSCEKQENTGGCGCEDMSAVPGNNAEGCGCDDISATSDNIGNSADTGDSACCKAA